MEFYERLSGARMHANFFRVGGISQKIPLLFYKDVFLFVQQFNHTLTEIDDFLSNNTI
jgi:NADH dehydrogenase (ubiquinone) Fe-S protein 2